MALVVGAAAVKSLIDSGQKYSSAREYAQDKDDSELMNDLHDSDTAKKTAAYATLKERGYTKEDMFGD